MNISQCPLLQLATSRLRSREHVSEVTHLPQQPALCTWDHLLRSQRRAPKQQSMSRPCCRNTVVSWPSRSTHSKSNSWPTLPKDAWNPYASITSFASLEASLYAEVSVEGASCCHTYKCTHMTETLDKHFCAFCIQVVPGAEGTGANSRDY